MHDHRCHGRCCIRAVVLRHAPRRAYALHLLVCGVVSCTAACAALAQQPYPLRPIRIIVPISPGSPPDVLARLLGEKLAASLGQSVIVENRPGASGTVGIDAVAKASADGHTLGLLTLGFLTAPALLASMPYDAVRDLAAVALIARDSNLLVVPNGSALASVAELIKTAKSRPGMLKFASGGNSTSAHLVGELFKREAGVDLVHIPYKGPVAGVTALIAGEVDMMFGAMGAVMSQVKSGRLRVLAVSAPRRIAAYPNAPALAEVGLPRVSFFNWFGLVAPTATPKAAIARLQREIQAIVATPETQQRLDAIGLEAASAGPAEFGALLRADQQRMIQLVRDAGIKPD